MAPLRLSFACWDYDRMRALQDGRVQPAGVDLTFLPLTVEETFYRQARYREFDVSELSLSSYLLTLGEPGEGERREKLALDLPDRIQVEPIPPGDNLSGMLADGRLDAILSPGRPSCVGTAPGVRLLFEDFKAVEQDYFRRTSIFPIMHVVVLRRSLYERHPWLARELTKAFEESLRLAYEDLTHRNALKVMLPWLQEHLAETIEVLGAGYWDYGLEPNRHVLETFARYSYEQGLAKRLYRAEEIVLPAASDAFTL